jgi:hypothetical protein
MDDGLATLPSAARRRPPRPCVVMHTGAPGSLPAETMASGAALASTSKGSASRSRKPTRTSRYFSRRSTLAASHDDVMSTSPRLQPVRELHRGAERELRALGAVEGNGHGRRFRRFTVGPRVRRGTGLRRRDAGRLRAAPRRGRASGRRPRAHRRCAHQGREAVLQTVSGGNNRRVALGELGGGLPARAVLDRSRVDHAYVSARADNREGPLRAPPQEFAELCGRRSASRLPRRAGSRHRRSAPTAVRARWSPIPRRPPMIMATAPRDRTSPPRAWHARGRTGAPGARAIRGRRRAGTRASG